MTPNKQPDPLQKEEVPTQELERINNAAIEYSENEFDDGLYRDTAYIAHKTGAEAEYLHAHKEKTQGERIAEILGSDLKLSDYVQKCLDAGVAPVIRFVDSETADLLCRLSASNARIAALEKEFAEANQKIRELQISHDSHI